MIAITFFAASKLVRSFLQEFMDIMDAGKYGYNSVRNTAARSSKE